MKFLEESQDKDYLSSIKEIQDVFKNVIVALCETKSMFFHKALTSLESVSKMSTIEFEVFLKKYSEDFDYMSHNGFSYENLVSAIVKNGTKKYSFLEKNFKYKKTKGVSVVEKNYNLDLYSSINEIKKIENIEKSQIYNELILIYEDAQNLVKNNLLNSDLVVGITKYVLFKHFGVNKLTHKTEKNKIDLLVAGLAIANKNLELLENFNNLFDRNITIPKNNIDKPDDNYKTLNVIKVKGASESTQEELYFKDVKVVNWENELNTKALIKYLPNILNYWLLKDKEGDIYLVDKKNVLIPANLKDITFVRDKNMIFNEKEEKINYDVLMDIVTKNILNKKELFEQYSFFEAENSIGIIEKMKIHPNGIVEMKAYVLYEERDDIYLSRKSYRFDVKDIKNLKPASDLKINLFMTNCERYSRMYKVWDLQHKVRHI